MFSLQGTAGFGRIGLILRHLERQEALSWPEESITATGFWLLPSYKNLQINELRRCDEVDLLFYSSISRSQDGDRGSWKGDGLSSRGQSLADGRVVWVRVPVGPGGDPYVLIAPKSHERDRSREARFGRPGSIEGDPDFVRVGLILIHDQ